MAQDLRERLRVAVVHRHNLALSGDLAPNWKLHSFTIGAETVSFWKIFDSAFATPSRYVQEMFVRLSKLDEGGEPCPKFVFNPLFEATWLTVAQVLESLSTLAPFEGITVLSDPNGLPAGYLFPDWLRVEDARFLTLLSTIDAEVDAELCRRAFFCDTRHMAVKRLSLGWAQQNGFVYGANKSVYRWMADRAIAMLSPLEGLPVPEAVGRRNAIPFTAVMPHHAGDALFFALAWDAAGSHIGRLAVNKAYCDVVEDLAPGLSLSPLDHPLANRGEELRQGRTMPDPDYFNSFRDGLPHDSFYYYCRPSRDYNSTYFHLIDHFAFALGQQFCSRDSFLSLRRRMPVPFWPDTSATPRVLLHFDAGWPLKIYPKKYQERLIDLLYEQGYEITVLAGTSYEHPKCRVATFQSYASFKVLIKSHHILVGMDSFPCHYAAHVLGLATICLFASTRPENSDAPGARNYACLEKGLSCRPCYEIVRCPVYGKGFCENFVEPEIVAAQATRMLQTGDRLEEAEPAVGSLRRQSDCCPSASDAIGPVRRISLKHLRLKVLVLGFLLPYVRYGALVCREYAAAVRKEGALLATVRALRFLRKAAWR
jgi:hypothetical protein